MPRGGKREGAGRKSDVLRYHGKRRRIVGDDERPGWIGKRPFLIGQRCEVLWREAYPSNFLGFHSADDKRPQARKRIIAQVMEEFEESWWNVKKFWDDYRRLEADLREDLG